MDRQRLADERAALTKVIRMHRTVAEGRTEEISCYVTLGLYPDGRPGEVFLKVDRQGSTLSGFADAVAIALSVGLQHGVPIWAYSRKFRGMRFEPMGMTGDPDQPFASSLLDALGTWLLKKFPPPEDERAPR